MTNEETLFLACQALGLQEDVRLIDQKGFRWTLDYVQDQAKPDFGSNMIKLEIMLQEKTGRPIDLRVGARPDKNKRFDRNYLRGIEKLEE